jgi:DUF4097 and DUF4098 domain-containing protein YvlB
MNMKKMILLLALCGSMTLCAPLFAGSDAKEPLAVYPFPAAAVERLTVVSSGGSIRVTGDAGETATVEVSVTTNGRKKRKKEELQKMLEQHYTLVVAATEGELRVEASRKNTPLPDCDGLSLSFRIRVPKRVSTQLNTRGGSLRLKGLTGRQELKTGGGSLHIANIDGPVKGVTSGGSLRVEGCRGEIELSTGGGSIRVDDCNGKIALRTSGGSIRLEHLNGAIAAQTGAGNLVLKDVSGDIGVKTGGGSIRAERVTGALSAETGAGSVQMKRIAGNLEARTGAGQMNVQMDAVDDHVRLAGSSSNITLSLPEGKGYRLKILARDIRTEKAVTGFAGSFESQRIEGTLNGGGTEVDVRSKLRVDLVFE